MNPYENDFADFRDPGDEAAEQDAEHFSPCGCGDARCRLDDRDATNVQVNGRWFTADCVGLCMVCGHVDDLQQLMKAGWGRFMHAFRCPDWMNEVRR